MRVLIINGSPRRGGNTSIALSEMEKVFAENKIEVDNYQIGNLDIRGCLACNYCYKAGKCAIDDIVNELNEKFAQADGLVIATPVYFASASGTLIFLLDRLFYSSSFDKRDKVGASVVCARRSGCTATFDELNKYFSISGMPIATSNYWNNIHGRKVLESLKDYEGLQTMRELAKNMVFLMKSIELGKKEFGLPEQEKKVMTNFID